MSNETIDDVTGGINAITGSAGKIATQQIELFTLAIESVTQLFVPISKTATDLVTGTLTALNQVLESVSTALAPKK
ncbi:MAG: chlorosome envelope protein B [Chlorobiaceae bacterium]|nr:chlorosome envelope protein B [Chlorobiaceae bacterium]